MRVSRGQRSSKDWDDDSRALHKRLMLEGACLDVDPDIFFPDTGGKKLPRAKINLAVDICSRCPVIKECLEWALTNEDHGIWGGKTSTERDRLRKERDDSTN